MNQFVESLRRLYAVGRLDVTKVAELYKNGKITKDEKGYILSTN